MASKKRRKPRPRRPAPAQPVVEQRAPARKQAAAKRPRAPISDERPPAPWGSFPLVELVVLVALVLLAVGFFSSGSRGTTLLVTGFVLGSLAGLELSIREHFAGYRSHTTLLAAAVGVASMLGLYYLADLSPTVCVAGGAAIGLVCAWLFVRAFRNRAGRAVKLR